MKKITTILLTIVLMFTLVTTVAISASATNADLATPEQETATTEEAAQDDSNVTAMKAIAAAIVVAVVGAAGAVGMAMAISKSAESMARQPEIASKINSTMMLGIVFIETAIIYALIVAILIIFVL